MKSPASHFQEKQSKPSNNAVDSGGSFLGVVVYGFLWRGRRVRVRIDFGMENGKKMGCPHIKNELSQSSKYPLT